MEYKNEEKVQLTKYSHGGGCGCKIAPSVLQEILAGVTKMDYPANLIVGNGSNDDAAVYDLENGTAIISTTDFFMPIVDDAYDFGRIAAANAISDVYAMGGKPIMAIAMLGWPVKLLPATLAGKVLDGGRSICQAAGIPLAGGHSIDSPEPFFGLAVSGLVPINQLKRNNTAQAGDLLYLTKPIGVGIMTTAHKRGVLMDGHYELVVRQLTTLNNIGQLIAHLPQVHAMTDVTGFGLLGHVFEMATGAQLSTDLFYDEIPKLPVDKYLEQNIRPDATSRNWNSYSENIWMTDAIDQTFAKNLLPDPQTNGGLLIAVAPDGVPHLEAILTANNLADFARPIGRMLSKGEKTIHILPHSN